MCQQGGWILHPDIIFQPERERREWLGGKAENVPSRATRCRAANVQGVGVAEAYSMTRPGAREPCLPCVLET